MDIPLTVSEMMDKRNSDKLSERRLIRMPEDFRNLYMIELHDYISIRATDNKNTIVLKVAPAYKEDVENDSLSAYVTTEAFEMSNVKGIKTSKRSQDVELVQGITLGCDPEAFLVDPRDNIIPANLFFRKYANVGYDGVMIEFRPMPSLSERTVAENLMKLITSARHKLDKAHNRSLAYRGIPAGKYIKLLAASSHKNTAAGFHLHFGLPGQLLGNHLHTRKMLAGQMVKALDFYVGIPAIIPEGITDHFRRTFVTSQYGKPGNYILDNRTLEYRVPGGSLLRHPVLTEGILGLGAVVIEDIVSRIKTITNNYVLLESMLPDESLKAVYPHLPTAADIYKAIVNPNTAFAESKLDTIISDVRQMIGYESRKSSVENFFKFIRHSFSNDINYNWRKYYEGQSRPVDMY
jgi:hypothetical protein